MYGSLIAIAYVNEINEDEGRGAPIGHGSYSDALQLPMGKARCVLPVMAGQLLTTRGIFQFGLLTGQIPLAEAEKIPVQPEVTLSSPFTRPRFCETWIDQFDNHCLSAVGGCHGNVSVGIRTPSPCQEHVANLVSSQAVPIPTGRDRADRPTRPSTRSALGDDQLVVPFRDSIPHCVWRTAVVGPKGKLHERKQDRQSFGRRSAGSPTVSSITFDESCLPRITRLT